jgi:hypothetical protein
VKSEKATMPSISDLATTKVVVTVTVAHILQAPVCVPGERNTLGKELEFDMLISQCGVLQYRRH